VEKKNIGLELLRVWLSLEVVIDHFWHQKGLTGVWAFLSCMRSLAVPCFLLMSFYLTANRYATGDGDWLKRRFGRLCVPYFVWPLVYYALIVVCSALSGAFVSSTVKTTEFSHYGFDLAVNGWDILRQWVFGIDRRLVHQFWFHSNMIFWTAGMFLLLKHVVSARKRTAIFVGCIMLGLVMQYSGINDFVFDRFCFEFKYSLGRLFATLPYVAVALLIGFQRKRIEAASGQTKALFAVIGLFLLFFVHYSHGFPRPRGLGYQGVSLLLMALGTVSFFHCLPFDRVPSIIVNAIGWASKFCMGIYCCHLAVGWVLHAWLFPRIGVGFESLSACCWIWCVSWAVCFLIWLVPMRFAKSLVQ
jgi:hypothetical protein